jgi:hypothetical protein
LASIKHHENLKATIKASRSLQQSNACPALQASANIEIEKCEPRHFFGTVVPEEPEEAPNPSAITDKRYEINGE